MKLSVCHLVSCPLRVKPQNTDGHLSHDASVCASCYNKQPGTAVIQGTIEPQGDVFARRSMARRQYNVYLMTLSTFTITVITEVISRHLKQHCHTKSLEGNYKSMLFRWNYSTSDCIGTERPINKYYEASIYRSVSERVRTQGRLRTGPTVRTRLYCIAF